MGRRDDGAVEPLPKPVTLAAVKAEPKLKDMALVKYSRLVGAAGTAERVEARLQDGRHGGAMIVIGFCAAHSSLVALKRYIAISKPSSSQFILNRCGNLGGRDGFARLSVTTGGQ